MAVLRFWHVGLPAPGKQDNTNTHTLHWDTWATTATHGGGNDDDDDDVDAGNNALDVLHYEHVVQSDTRSWSCSLNIQLHLGILFHPASSYLFPRPSVVPFLLSFWQKTEKYVGQKCVVFRLIVACGQAHDCRPLFRSRNPSPCRPPVIQSFDL